MSEQGSGLHYDLAAKSMLRRAAQHIDSGSISSARAAIGIALRDLDDLEAVLAIGDKSDAPRGDEKHLGNNLQRQYSTGKTGGKRSGDSASAIETDEL